MTFRPLHLALKMFLKCAQPRSYERRSTNLLRNRNADARQLSTVCTHLQLGLQSFCHAGIFPQHCCPKLFQRNADQAVAAIKRQLLRKQASRHKIASATFTAFHQQGSLKDTFCPFEAWLFPPK
ncbi:unnamed protein product [Effrenium voratum]|nr:unnamed protein product [Effrenium voratum]